MANRRNLFSLLLPAIALIGLASCQAVPQNVADSQKPPTAELRRQIAKMMSSYDGKVAFAEISSVVVWDAKKNINAFCIRITDEGSDQLGYASTSMINGKIVDVILHDNWCRDKRLRWYAFPEARNINRG